MKSIEEKIFKLDPKTTLYPGHGPADNRSGRNGE